MTPIASVVPLGDAYRSNIRGKSAGTAAGGHLAYRSLETMRTRLRGAGREHVGQW